MGTSRELPRVVEKLFERIAKGLDNHLPSGESWHRALIGQMAADVENVRPVVISAALATQLDESRRFRHVVRSVYSYELDAERLGVLVSDSFEVYALIEKELVDFSRWLITIE